MNLHQEKDLTIEVFDDPTYKYGSVDNVFNYSKHYFGDQAEKYPTTKHGIRIFRDNQVVNSCILIGTGGATGVHKNSSLFDSGQLVICCCDTVFCLSVPQLELKWKTKADQATCFQVFKLHDDYIIHGELQITRIGRDGKIKWQFGGADIFVTIEGKEELEFADDHIILTDFGSTKYKIDFDGKLIQVFN